MICSACTQGAEQAAKGNIQAAIVLHRSFCPGYKHCDCQHRVGENNVEHRYSKEKTAELDSVVSNENTDLVESTVVSKENTETIVTD